MVIYTKKIDSDNIEDFISSDFKLIYIWAPWFKPSEENLQSIDYLSYKFKDIISIGKINIEENKDLVKKLNIRNIPIAILYKDGNKLDTLEDINKKKLVKFIEENKI